ncbi:MAG: carboxypeptidase-like regulatory domain-containing protein [Myxococcales bacterium]|nr:carboxypeptidase-like regulatory domain-containing protein [Myxococcales bacterium]
MLDACTICSWRRHAEAAVPRPARDYLATTAVIVALSLLATLAASGPAAAQATALEVTGTTAANTGDGTAAEEASPIDAHGRRDDALPGLSAVALTGTATPGRLSLAGGLGYGFTGDVLEDDENHHRLALRAGVAYEALRWLILGYALEGRLHRQVGGTDAGDGGFLIHSRFALRAGKTLTDDFALGAELAVELPAAASPAAAITAIGAGLSLMATHTSGPLLLAANAGIRLDRAGEAIDDPRRLSGADRIALGTADATGLPLGLGASYRLGSLTPFGEVSWEPRVGRNAQKALSAPMWVTLGLKLELKKGLRWVLSASVSPSARPDAIVATPGQPDVPLSVVDPRAWLRTGLQWSAPRASARAGDDSASHAVEGSVRGADGAPVSGASVSWVDDPKVSTTSDADGRFRLQGLPAGAQRLRVQAPGLSPEELTVQVPADPKTPLTIELKPLSTGLTGQVLRSDGTPIAAAQVELHPAPATEATPGDAPASRLPPPVTTTQTDAEGRFAFADLQPGQTKLIVTAPEMRAHEQPLELTAGSSQELAITLERDLPEGHIRGQVRDFRSQGVRAKVQIDPGGLTLETDADGNFEVDVAPGRYTVRVQASGYRVQKRPAVVENQGVTVLIIELKRKGR